MVPTYAGYGGKKAFKRVLLHNHDASTERIRYILNSKLHWQ